MSAQEKKIIRRSSRYVCLLYRCHLFQRVHENGVLYDNTTRFSLLAQTLFEGRCARIYLSYQLPPQLYESLNPGCLVASRALDLLVVKLPADFCNHFLQLIRKLRWVAR